MEKVIIRGGQEAELVFDDKNQCVRVKVGAVSHLVTYMRDNQVKVKNDIILNTADLTRVRTYMKRFIKAADPKSKKRK